MGVLDSVSDDILIDLKFQYKTYNEMGKALGINSDTICKEFKKRGIVVGKLSHIKNEQLIAYREDNMSYESISSLLGVSINTVINEYRARNINIEISKEADRILADVEDREFIALRNKGKTYQEIADYYNVSKSLIIKELDKRGIKDERINRKSKLVSLDSDILKSLRIEGNTYENIAEILDVSTVAIHKEYKNRGLK